MLPSVDYYEIKESDLRCETRVTFSTDTYSISTDYETFIHGHVAWIYSIPC